MPQRLDPKFDVLPAAQQQIWNALAAAPRLGFVLYGGTAIALHLGHRSSIDFDFFRSEPLDKNQLRANFEFVKEQPCCKTRRIRRLCSPKCQLVR
jgi:Nucleotidyl transferase AbiEii toxin, Type IV TA system